LERIFLKYLKQFFSFWFQSSGGELLSILLRLFGKYNFPFHQGSSVEHFSTGVLSPRMIDSRIFGIDNKYKVSCIDLQSSIDINTPAFFLLTIWIGSCDFSDSDRSFGILAFVTFTVLIIIPLVLIIVMYSFLSL
jgi:hypothetical protein